MKEYYKWVSLYFFNLPNHGKGVKNIPPSTSCKKGMLMMGLKMEGIEY
jgi:hypothetical protein